jgi:hypothetical protein
MRILIAVASTVAFMAVAGMARADTLTSFHTPSKNIYCMASESEDANFLDCEILVMTRQAPLMPRPDDCDLEWGNRFQVGEANDAYLGCTGDTLRDDTGQTLAYGTSFQSGGITCTSSEKGLECRNGDGHGFFLSKGKQELF